MFIFSDTFCWAIKWLRWIFVWYIYSAMGSCFGRRERTQCFCPGRQWRDDMSCTRRENTLVLKSAFNKFSSLTVTDVSNKGYVDPRRICVKSPGQPWLLLTHAASSLHGSTCDIFCGPLMPCVYVGVVYGRDTLFWHQMQCSCGTDGCNELVLHMLPDDQATILICDLMFA